MATQSSDLISELQSITDELVVSYNECGRLHHLGHEPLPSRIEIIAILEQLFEVMYPGYGQRSHLHSGNIVYHVGNLIDSLSNRLTEQITRALRHERCREDANFDCEAEARHMALGFLQKLPDIRRLLEQDVEAAFRGDPAAKNHFEIIFSYPGLDAITVYRLAHELHRLTVPYIPRMMTEHAHSKTGIDIHPGAEIDAGFFIDHGTGVVIGETTTIGRNVKLYQGVTLGALSFDRDDSGSLVHGSYKRHPTLQDDVVVYANATILGGKTTIGEAAVIGSNVWLTKSVEPYAVIVLDNPKHKVKRNGDGEVAWVYEI